MTYDGFRAAGMIICQSGDVWMSNVEEGSYDGICMLQLTA